MYNSLCVTDNHLHIQSLCRTYTSLLIFQSHASKKAPICYASTISVISTLQLRSNLHNRSPGVTVVSGVVSVWVSKNFLLSSMHWNSGGAIWTARSLWLLLTTAPTLSLSPRQTRWAERLSRFQFTWEYRPGRVNVADPLSRHPAFEAITALSSIALDLSCLTLGSADGAMLSAVVTRGRAPPPPPAAQHPRTDVPDGTAPAAAHMHRHV